MVRTGRKEGGRNPPYLLECNRESRESLVVYGGPHVIP